MRTTVTIHDQLFDQITGYVAATDKLARRKITISEAIETCIGLSLPLLVERLPLAAERPEDTLRRRSSALQAKIESPGLSDAEVEHLMREALALQDDARAAFLRQAPRQVDTEKYRACLDLALKVYNTGALRLAGEKYRGLR